MTSKLEQCKKEIADRHSNLIESVGKVDLDILVPIMARALGVGRYNVTTIETAMVDLYTEPLGPALDDPRALEG